VSAVWDGEPALNETKGMLFMRSRFRIVLVASLAVFAVGAIASASASAQTWEECAEGHKEFKTSLCTEAAGTGPFGWQEITTAKKVTSSGTWKLTDKGFLGAGVTLTCEVTTEGAVGAGKKGETGGIRVVKCQSSNPSLCSTPALAVLGAPWETELKAETGGGIREIITQGAKEVGWEVACQNGFVDKCTTKSLSAGMKNNAATGTVEATFDAKTPKLNCTNGGAGQGEILGTSTDKKVTLGAIRVK
jgi:hypothetical protein